MNQALLAAALSVCSRHAYDHNQDFINKCWALQIQSGLAVIHQQDEAKSRQDAYDLSVIEQALKEVGK